MNYHEGAESETPSDSDDDGNDSLLSYGLKLRAADPRYITHGDDRDSRSWGWCGQRPAGPGNLAGIGSSASTMEQT